MVQIKESSLEALGALRDLYIGRKAWVQALETEEKVRKQIKTPEEDQRFIGLQYESAKERFRKDDPRLYEQVLKDLREITNDNKRFIPAYTLSAEVYKKMGKLNDAGRVYGRGFAKTGHVVFLRQMEDLYIDRGEPGVILKIYRRLLEVAPRNQLLMFFYARLCLKLEMIDEAIDLLKTLLAEEKEFRGLHRAMAEAYIHRGKFEDAVREFSRAFPMSQVYLPFYCAKCQAVKEEWTDFCETCSQLEHDQYQAGRPLFPGGRKPARALRGKLGGDMMDDLILANDNKIIFLVLDGLGDIPDPAHAFMTPLEAAKKPNMDRLAVEKGVLGRTIPVGVGITPGSGPGHLSLFGYDPARYEIGRGILEVLGLNMDLEPSDVAARGNFCTVKDGMVTDRRAGRIETSVGERLCRAAVEGDPVGGRGKGAHQAGRLAQVRDRLQGRGPVRRAGGRGPAQGREAPRMGGPENTRGREDRRGRQRVHEKGDGRAQGRAGGERGPAQGLLEEPRHTPVPREIPDGLPGDHHLSHVPGDRQGAGHEGGEGAGGL